MGRNRAFEVQRGEANLCLRMLEDVAQLGAVQLGIGGDRHEAGVPDGVEHVEIVG